MTSFSWFTWLVHSAWASTIILALGTIAVSVCRQPAIRLRLIQWSLMATICSLALVAIPQLSAFSLGVVGSNAPPPAATSSARPSLSSPPTTSATAFIAEAQRTVPADVGGLPERPAPSSADEPHEPAREPAPVASTDPSAWVFPAMCIAYVLGALFFLVRWGRARLKLVRLLRNSREVPLAVRAELDRIGGRDSERIRLLASPAVAGPVTWGTRQPVIVIPSSVVDQSDTVPLRYYLAHEWAHVVRRDFATWQFATLLQVFLYYQPLFWWLRNRLALCMDQLADADASDQGESTADYADFLVQLARGRLAPNPQLALGISDRRSSLYQRVVFLLNAPRPRATCPRGRSLAIGALALLLAAFVSAVRLDAEPAANGPGEPAAQPAVVPPAESAAIAQKPADSVATPQEPTEPTAGEFASTGADGSITYYGLVTDGVTGKGIPDVNVTVHHKESYGWTTLEITEHQTDTQGRYRFVIPPRQAAMVQLYLEVEAQHPNYSPKSRSGYSHAMIKKNLALGEAPFYSNIRLWPGEAVTGIVVSPEGQPLPDVEVSMYSKSAHVTEMFGGAAWAKTKTDANGAFRLVPATPGDGVLWIKPEHYAPQAHRLANRRGDWGRIAVEKGVDVTGRLLDVQGQPVANVKINARRRGDGEQPDDFLNQNAVAGQIGRIVVTSPAGEFTLAALPAGEYELRFQSNTDSYDPPPLEQVFLFHTLTIAQGGAPQFVEIRAVPHVLIKGQYLNSAGKPRRGHEVTFIGKIDGRFYFTESNQPGEDGKFEIRAPHGIADARLDLSTNEHSALRWRLKPDEPLRRGRDITLGTLEDDIQGLEVVRYVAPILLVKAVDEAGEPILEFAPVLKYTRTQDENEQLTVYTTGSHVSFEAQRDGRSRSEQLLPDEPFSVTVEKAGYSTTAQDLSLPEGETQELTFLLKKEPADVSLHEGDTRELIFVAE